MGNIPYKKPVHSSSFGTVSHYALVRSDGEVAYDCPWFTFTVNGSDASVLDVTFNARANYNADVLGSSSDPTNQIYTLLDITANPMAEDLAASGNVTYDVLASTGTYNTSTKGVGFSIQFFGDAIVSIEQVLSVSSNDVEVADASIYFVGQVLAFYATDVYAVPTVITTATILSIDTGTDLLTLDAIPSGGISTNYYIFQGSPLWAFLKYTTTS